MDKTFINKYRVTTFKEIKQNDTIVKLYDKMIQNNKLAVLKPSHCYPDTINFYLRQQVLFNLK